MAIERYIVELSFKDKATWTANHPRSGMEANQHEAMALSTFRRWGEIAENHGTPVVLTMSFVGHAGVVNVIRSFSWEA
jgi:hypothetical protein